MRILLLGGTSDARLLAYRLIDEGHTVELRTLTVYGKALASDPEMVSGGEGLGILEVEAGALDEALLETRMRVCDAVVDATHPHAARISESAIAVAARLGKPLLRFERPEAELGEGVHVVADHDAAARKAAELVGDGEVALLTTGSRNIENYAKMPLPSGARWVARVLPDAASLAACTAAGLTPAQIIAMQGPVSEGLERAFLRHFGARVLVAKESGSAGGTAEKIAAAKAEGIAVVVVGRPRLAYPWIATDADTLITRLRKTEPGFTESAPASGIAATTSEPGCFQLYTGEGKGKTTAAIGLAVRAAGAKKRVTFIQFLKGGAESAELESLRKLGIFVTRLAEKPTGILRGQVTDEDRALAAATLAQAHAALASGEWDLVVLDELHGALRHGLIDEAEVLSAIRGRSRNTEVVSTGRHASEALRHAADLVTEMRCERHYFSKGVAARRGIEF